MTKVAIVILNWNGKHFLEQFLPYLVKHNEGGEVWVADNGSTDDSIDFLKATYPSVKTLELPENYGFTGGYNKALEQIEAEYYVLLNSDVEVTEGWLSHQIELLDNNPEIAACQPKILTHANKTHFEHAGAAGGYIDYAGYPFCRGRVFHTFEEDKGQYDDTCEIFWATGACLTVRSEIWHKLGGLETDFFAHMEEIDLCWRIQNHGHKVYYCGKSHVYHVGGGTLNRKNPRKTYLNFRNGLILLFKNLPKRKFLPLIFWRMILDGVAALDFLLVGYWKDSFAVFRAHMSFYSRLRFWIKRRRETQKLVNRNNRDNIYPRSIVWQYFILGKKTFDQFGFKSKTKNNKN